MLDVHRLGIACAACCFVQLHNHKWNAFKSSRLFDRGTQERLRTRGHHPLSPGEFTAVRPGECHRFRSLSELVEAIEIYSPAELAEDIVSARKSGGFSMEYGDEIMGSGLARGAHARGVKIAFGDGRKIIWNECAHLIFRGNPNVAAPGQERADNLEWIEHYSGARRYYRFGSGERRQMIFASGTQRPGELFFDPSELEFAERVGDDFIVVEPNTVNDAPNKQWGRQNKRWGLDRYRGVAHLLRDRGFRVVQFDAGAQAIDGIERIATPSFRTACAVLARAALYVGPEGGLHHACAASPVNTPAVVIFGGFVSPAVTGYAQHVNLFTGEGLGCGNLDPCEHCRVCMSKISVEQVIDAAMSLLK